MSKTLDQKGAVSLLSVVIFATIITVLITAYMRAAVSQQSESLSYDFSNRAYYAAESGVQDTLRELKSNPANQVDKNTCAPIESASAENFGYADFGVGYTCQLIKVNPLDLSGSVIPNQQTAMMQLKPATAVTSPSVVIRWSEQHQVGSSDPILYPRASDSSLFTPTDKWLAGGFSTRPVHALLRVSVIDAPANGVFGRDEIQQRVMFLNPANSSAGTLTLNHTSTVAQQQDQLIHNAECYKSDNVTGSDMQTYSCKQKIDLAGYSFTDSNIYLRIGAVYRSTKFSVQLLSGGTPVNLQGAQIEVDITAKAGENTYRRLKQTVSLGGFEIQYGPDAALIAGEGICKNFVIGTVASTYQQGCNPLN